MIFSDSFIIKRTCLCHEAAYIPDSYSLNASGGYGEKDGGCQGVMTNITIVNNWQI